MFLNKYVNKEMIDVDTYIKKIITSATVIGIKPFFLTVLFTRVF